MHPQDSGVSWAGVRAEQSPSAPGIRPGTPRLTQAQESGGSGRHGPALSQHASLVITVLDLFSLLDSIYPLILLEQRRKESPWIRTDSLCTNHGFHFLYFMMACYLGPLHTQEGQKGYLILVIAAATPL